MSHSHDSRYVLHIRITPEMKDALGKLAFKSNVSMNDVVAELIARATGFGFVGYEAVLKRVKYGKPTRKLRCYLEVPGAINGIE